MGILLSCCDPNREEAEGLDRAGGDAVAAGDRTGLISNEVYAPTVSETGFVAGSFGGGGGGSSGINGGLPGSVGSMGNGLSGTAGSMRNSVTLGEQREREEGSTLQDILNEMTVKVVDLDQEREKPTLALGAPSGGPEPNFVHERAKEYGRRLQKVSYALVVKHAGQSSNHRVQDPGAKMTDAGHDLDQELGKNAISDSDAMLVREVSARAQEAVMEFRVEHRDDLVVEVQYPQQQQPESAMINGR